MVQSQGLRPAAVRSPVVLGAAGAVLGCAALLGWTVTATVAAVARRARQELRPLAGCDAR